MARPGARPSVLLAAVLLLLLLPSAASVAEPELEAAIAALRARGYNLFGNAITASDLRFELLRANASFTLFAPTDAGLFALDMSLPAAAYVRALRYHVALGRLDLGSLPDGAALPTLLPRREIPLTRRSPEALLVAGVDVVLPGLFYGSDVAVHGLGGILSPRRRRSLSPQESASPPDSPTPSTSPSRIRYPGFKLPDLRHLPAMSPKSNHPPPRWPDFCHSPAITPKFPHIPSESPYTIHLPKRSARQPEFGHSPSGPPYPSLTPDRSVEPPEFHHSSPEPQHTSLPPESSAEPPDALASAAWSSTTDLFLIEPAWSSAGAPDPWAPSSFPNLELTRPASEKPAPTPSLVSPVLAAGGTATLPTTAEHGGREAQLVEEMVFPTGNPPSTTPAAGFSRGEGGACLSEEPLECALIEAFGHVIGHLDPPRGQLTVDAL